MNEFPVIGQTLPSRAPVLSAQRTINFFPEVDRDQKTPIALVGTPGMESIWTSLNAWPRGHVVMGDYLYVVADSHFFRISKGGTIEVKGSLTTTVGRVSMDHNGTQVMAVDGTNGYIWDGQKLQIITDADFVGLNPDQVVFHDSYFIVNEPGTGRMYRSDSYDGLSWDAANVATAEFKPDNLVKLATDRQLWVYGEYTTEPWYNDGGANFPFSPLLQSRSVFGIAAKNSWARVENTSYWVSQNEHGGYSVVRNTGSAPQVISTSGLEYMISTFQDISDAFAYSMYFEGHYWYVLTFPLADHGRGRTYAYDAKADFWFEWGDYLDTIDDFIRHPMEVYEFFGGKHIVIDRDGNIYQLKSNVYLNGSTPIISERRTAATHKDRRRVSYSLLELDMETGEGTTSGQGYTPDVMLRTSNDGGHSWSNTRTTSLGKTGEHRTRVRFHRLGSAYDMVFRISVSDPVPRKLVGGYLEAA